MTAREKGLKLEELKNILPRATLCLLAPIFIIILIFLTPFFLIIDLFKYIFGLKNDDVNSDYYNRWIS